MKVSWIVLWSTMPFVFLIPLRMKISNPKKLVSKLLDICTFIKPF